MSVACLILGYRAPEVLAYALPTLSEAGFDIYVHVDRKIDTAQYVSRLGKAAGLCSILAQQIEVFWGGFSMVRAELLLLETARAKNNYDKYLLISDDSFPVYPAAMLATKFNVPGEQISLRVQGEESPFYDRYHGFFCYDHPATTVQTPMSASTGHAIRRIDSNLFEHMIAIEFLRRHGKKKIDVYYGPQFWALTDKTVRFILNDILNDLHFVKSMEYAALPDELFFQSALGNFTDLRYSETAPVFANFAAGDSRVFGSIDKLPLDINEPHSFVRKISPGATGMLTLMSDRLKANRSIFDTDPNVLPSHLQVRGIDGKDIIKFRLRAPSESDDRPGWHGVEVGWGRRFRWTAASRLEWDVTLPVGEVDTFQFVVSLTIGIHPTWMSECRLEVDGVTKAFEHAGGELSAEFKLTPGASYKVTLLTPAPRVPPETLRDQRHLGLAIGL